jgi:acyl-CoA synthetase (AMP-forming)/AMP-acid ligase II
VLLENEHIADAAVVDIKLYAAPRPPQLPLLLPLSISNTCSPLFHLPFQESFLRTNKRVFSSTNSGEDEWPRAYVVLQPASRGKVSPEDIQEWTAARVAKHKRLVGGVAFIDEVPKLASGKIVRKVVRQWSRRDAEEMLKKGTAPVRARL